MVLALREDYLHYLLEVERGFDLDILNNDDSQPATIATTWAISRRDDARLLINRLTNEASFPLGT